MQPNIIHSSAHKLAAIYIQNSSNVWQNGAKRILTIRSMGKSISKVKQTHKDEKFAACGMKKVSLLIKKKSSTTSGLELDGMMN